MIEFIGEELKRSIIIIDKPSGPTSFQVSDFVRKKLSLNKTSHFGTLDPKVTGVLPVALGNAVRLTGYFSKQDKEYVGVMRLHEDVNEEKLKEVIEEKFLGKIKQLPPVKSRVKREEREREIKKFEILEKDRQDILFIVECQAGTYIRKLIHDLGKELGIGAHMAELRRTKASIFLEEQSITLYQLVEAVEEWKKGNSEKLKKMLIPIEIVQKIMPKMEVKKEYIEKLKHGSPLFKEMIAKNGNFEKDDDVAVFFDNELIEIAQTTIDSKNIKEIENNKEIAKPKAVFN